MRNVLLLLLLANWGTEKIRQPADLKEAELMLRFLTVHQKERKWSCWKAFQYLGSDRFSLHRGRESIFKRKREISVLGCGRISRWNQIQTWISYVLTSAVPPDFSIPSLPGWGKAEESHNLSWNSDKFCWGFFTGVDVCLHVYLSACGT